MAFTLLYLVCLALCLGVVQIARLWWPAKPPPPPPQKVERVALAVPPRPKGVRKVTGSGDEGYRYTEKACRKLQGQYRDICYHQLARQRALTDPEGALAACAQVSKDQTRWECMADVAELHAPNDRAWSLRSCPDIPNKKWRDQCVFGIALALAKQDPDGAFQICDGAGQWRDFCHHDVNGTISVFDTELAFKHCRNVQGDLLSHKSCWHGIGKYMARVDVDRAFATCARVPPGPDDLYIENCYHGLGWGAAEKGGAAFAQACRRAGDQRDSCLLGVAYNLRRFNAQGALDICDSVRRSDLKNQCKTFVSRGHL